MNTSKAHRLIWIDLEMTGLDFERERIIESTLLVTDFELELIAESETLVIHQSDELLAGMDEWNTEHHGASGLTDQVRASTISEKQAEDSMQAFVGEHTFEGKCPMAGNSVYQDRLFLRRYMPRLESWFHYRNVDVSTLKELVRHWHPEAYAGRPKKKNLHRTLDDIRESIEELAYYRKAVMSGSQAPTST